jgi:hypothetical protein
MSKKRKKQMRRPSSAMCERCGQVARTSVPLPITGASFAHKLGTIGLPRVYENVMKPVDADVAIQLAIEAGIIDKDGNLMPDYQ